MERIFLQKTYCPITSFDGFPGMSIDQFVQSTMCCCSSGDSEHTPITFTDFPKAMHTVRFVVTIYYAAPEFRIVAQILQRTLSVGTYTWPWLCCKHLLFCNILQLNSDLKRCRTNTQFLHPAIPSAHSLHKQPVPHAQSSCEHRSLFLHDCALLPPCFSKSAHYCTC